MTTFSDYIVYVDESGDHNLSRPSLEFPIFVLSFCVFKKEAYVAQIVPALQRIKFKHMGHDMVVFHEREIRKASGPFAFLTDADRRRVFLADLDEWVEQSPFTIIAVIIRKTEFAQEFPGSRNPYHIALRLGLARIEEHLRKYEPEAKLTHLVVEARGKREDEELELEFRRICDGHGSTHASFPFQLISAAKSSNSCGLQLADLTARPVGRHILNPDQPNHAYAIIETKLARSPDGEIFSFGLITYP